jgi:two-component system sensor histidine kinase KdpD
MRTATQAGRIAASIAAVFLVTSGLLRLPQVNPITVGLSYVVLILFIATGWGIASSTAASFVAIACFNYFFLPPVGTWTIADSQNWIALGAFLVTAVVASQLSGWARQRTIEALSRQRDLERLYALSRSILLAEHTDATPSLIARRIADAFAIPAVAIYDVGTDAVALGGAGELKDIEGRLRDVARQAVSVRDPAGLTVTAIRLGGAPIGSLALTDADVSDTVLQSIVNIAAIALERARGRQETARAEAARQSGELRATVLDALAHDFKTPLTSLKVASSDLGSDASLSARNRELVAIIDEEVSRLQGLVTDVVRMLRIDAGDFVVQRRRAHVSEVVRGALDHLGRRLDGHHLVNAVPAEVMIEADPELLQLAVQQLLDNAIKYSPPSSTIEVAATSNGDVRITVHNSGSFIPERERAKIVERFYRGTDARHTPGTGMGLSIVDQIAKAHGGALTVASAPATGTAFALSIPREFAE